MLTMSFIHRMLFCSTVKGQSFRQASGLPATKRFKKYHHQASFPGLETNRNGFLNGLPFQKCLVLAVSSFDANAKEDAQDASVQKLFSNAPHCVAACVPALKHVYNHLI